MYLFVMLVGWLAWLRGIGEGRKIERKQSRRAGSADKDMDKSGGGVVQLVRSRFSTLLLQRSRDHLITKIM